MTTSSLAALLAPALRAAVQAGDPILEVYSAEMQVEYKEDRSPLTLADTRSHAVIAAGLADTGIPVLSEEGKRIPYAERGRWRRLWVVDPLDGTKEFVKRLGEFTVNIALVEDGRPRLGAVFVPVTNRLYFGVVGEGAFRLDDPEAIAALRAPGPAGDPAEVLARLKTRATRLPLDTAAHTPFVIVGSHHPGGSLDAAGIRNIAAAADGTVWGVSSDGGIVRWNGTTFVRMPGAAVQVSVGSAANVWAVNSAGVVSKWNGTAWDAAADAGICKEVAAASDGTVLVIRASDRKAYRRQ